MATIVPISHSARWRSRSRGSSIDMCDHTHHDTSDTRRGGEEHTESSGVSEWEEEPSDDEDDNFDEPHSALWLVVPREYANTARTGRSALVNPYAGVSRYSAAKSMERRRANGSHH